MSYPIRSIPDGDTAWGPDLRFTTSAVNDHQSRLLALEGGLNSTLKTAAYTFVVGDFDVPTKAREFVYQSSSAGSFTLPTGVSGGLSVLVHQFGTGQLTIAPGTGVTLNSRGGAYKLAGQYAVAEIRSISSGTFLLIGDIIV